MLGSVYLKIAVILVAIGGGFYGGLRWQAGPLAEARAAAATERGRADRNAEAGTEIARACMAADAATAGDSRRTNALNDALNQARERLRRNDQDPNADPLADLLRDDGSVQRPEPAGN